MNRATTLVLVGLLLAGGCAFGQDVLLTGGEDRVRARAEANIAAVLAAMNGGSLSSARASFTPTGYQTALSLLDGVRMWTAAPVYESNLLALPKGGWEVRGIRMRVDMGDTKGIPHQELVFTLTPAGLVDDLRFAMERHHYQRLLEEGRELQDFAFRQQILRFVEDFRTAHNRKDLDFIEKVYSDDALIIVGKVVRTEERSSDMMQQLSKDKIQFVRKSKEQYIRDLGRVFDRNDFLKVGFDSIEITPHVRYDDIYGVTVKQRWRSSSYSDTGYVFFMMDFAEADEPLIHVRSWQPRKFNDGSVVGLYEFNIIR